MDLKFTIATIIGFASIFLMSVIGYQKAEPNTKRIIKVAWIVIGVVMCAVVLIYFEVFSAIWGLIQALVPFIWEYIILILLAFIWEYKIGILLVVIFGILAYFFRRFDNLMTLVHKNGDVLGAHEMYLAEETNYPQFVINKMTKTQSSTSKILAERSQQLLYFLGCQLRNYLAVGTMSDKEVWGGFNKWLCDEGRTEIGSGEFNQELDSLRRRELVKTFTLTDLGRDTLKDLPETSP